MSVFVFAARAVAPVVLLTASAFAQAPMAPGAFDWHPERAAGGPLVVIVSLPDQQAYVYRNGVRIGRTSVSTGRPGHVTPTGDRLILIRHSRA